MEYQEINMKGKLWMERVSVKPAWTANDKGRLIYAEDSHKLWIGTAAAWEIFDSTTETAVSQKLVNIGNWDMDTTASVSVTHGLSLGNIVGVRAVISSDTGALYSLSQLYYPGSPDNQGGISSIGTTTISLYRVAGGLFDSASFNYASMNRGYIIFDYAV